LLTKTSNILRTPASSTIRYVFLLLDALLKAVDNTGIGYRQTREAGGSQETIQLFISTACYTERSLALRLILSWSYSTFNHTGIVSFLTESWWGVQLHEYAFQFTFVKFVAVGTIYHSEQWEVLIMDPQ